ncbi:MAG: aryl-sulfate sulfotransferase [Candidatus Heimdallarchaeota archaeon]|nr:aryl-sulfate sulfotransferase [Candidatus Heimdallarchaeota archaeon]MCK4769238.1 aryl-sulfate sulfotransferase [Candidatus Heimdallarchaeota archaeon]
MKKRTKIIFISIGIFFLIIIAGGLTFFLTIKFKYKPVPLDLENAPSEIKDIREDLYPKLVNYLFTWEDMVDFVIFSQYVADNSPVVLELVKDWDDIVWFNVSDEDDMWFYIEDDSLTVEIGPNPPENYGIIINLNFETMVRIIKQDVTPQKAFQRGTLTFEGDLNDVLKVNQIVETAAATIMGTYAPPIEITDNFVISADESSLYTEKGLTLIPYIQVNLKEGQYGESHVSTPSHGKVLIVNNRGEIVYELEDSAHTVHKFINSNTVAMGGQEGFMELWNYQTGEVETLDVPGGHHDFDYNPTTDTFMVLEYVFSTETWNGYNILYDKLGEYTRDGELLWEWDGRTEFPFNATRHTSLGMNLTFRGGADWMHANSFVWDKQNEVVYLNIRNLDTIAKINYATKDVLWEAGRSCNFTLYNKQNNLVDSIFHSPHSLERIGEDRFIIFDNDLYNTSNPNSMTLEGSQGFSRFLEFEIDEEQEEMRELWSWEITNQTYYLPESGGDADRLPDGNTLGVFGNKALVLNEKSPTIITEVTQDGEIVWELTINGVNITYFWVHLVERFYEQPLVQLNEVDLDSESNELYLNLTTWNGYKIDSLTEGSLKLRAGKKVIYEKAFNFLPKWQPNNFEISLTDVSSNTNKIYLIIENQDGIQITVEIFNTGWTTRNTVLVIIIPVIGGGLIASVIILERKKKLFSQIFLKKS